MVWKHLQKYRTSSYNILINIYEEVIYLKKLKNQGVFVKHYGMPLVATVQKAIFSFNVKVKVTKSLTLVPFARVSLVEYACQKWSLYLLRFKIYSEG